MIASFSLLLASAAALSFASPIEVRSVAALNTAAFEEAQQKDTTATKAFSSTEIKTSTGQCLFVNELSGDFRANLNPIQVATCDGSAGQLWDVITAGKHNDQKGTMLVVNTLTGACMNFDPRRAAGNTVIMFSCGGRADGGGNVTPSQLFPLANSTTFSFAPLNAAGTCLAVTAKNVLDQAPCKAGDASQSFSFGTSGGAVVTPASTTTTTTDAVAEATTAPQAIASSTSSGCTSTTVITITRPRSTAASSSIAEASAIVESKSTSVTLAIDTSSSSAAAPAPTTTAGPAKGDVASSNPTTPVPVSRAGGVLQPSSAAESHPRDNTATRAFSSVSLKSSAGLCLFIDPTAGDFRQNLIPVQLQACTGAAGEKFDIITKGVHNNAANSTLVVSSLTQGCLNFDPRRAAGDTVMIFSCGGRADGGGAVTDSQLFSFGGGKSLALAPENAKGATCLVGANGKLDQTACDGKADQVFTIV